MKTLVLLLILSALSLQSRQFEVCSDCGYTRFSQVVPHIMPGDTVVISGTISGGDHISELKGNADSWIYILGQENATFDAGNTAIQLSDCEYLYFSGLTFQGQHYNGVNIDDAGSYESPTHHIKMVNCTFKDIDATGNNDLLKLSGLEDFEIVNCTFQNGSPGGSGIDMVGCINGLIANNYFRDLGTNSIKAKGGTRNIDITRNIFINGGNRGINIGGNTGLEFFRPQDSKTESQDMLVYSNIFVGGECAVAYVGTYHSYVFNNTIVGSRKWVFRILQETVDESRFIACGDNGFYNNLVVVNDSISRTVNIGGNTRPETFQFSNNAWYRIGGKTWNHNLPTDETNGIVGKDPELSERYGYNIYPPKGSFLIGAGRSLDRETLDYDSIPFLNPPTIGAFELGEKTGVIDAKGEHSLLLNDGVLHLENSYYLSYEVYNYAGELLLSSKIKSNEIDLNQIDNHFLIIILNSINKRDTFLIQK
jgi:hypothetical protein